MMEIYRKCEKREGKRRKYLRALALMLCACMVVTACPGMPGTVTAWAAEGQSGQKAAAPAESGRSAYMSYSNMKDSRCFNIRGIDNDREFQTTFMDDGYETASSVDGERKVRWNSASGVSMGGSLFGTRELSLLYEGRYVMIRYIVENKGSETRSFQVGSSADVMIDNNDYAPVVGTANGLSMSGSPMNSYSYNLVAPSADTLWYGFYAEAYDNMFTNLPDKATPYEKDSGMAWSWNGTVEPGQRWSRYVLLGVGELPPAPKMPTLTNKNPQLPTDSATNMTGTAEPGNTVCIEVNGEEYSAVADSSGKFSVPVTPPLDSPDGDTTIYYYAVSPEGGISDTGQTNGTVIVKPVITLTDSSIAIMEDSTVNDAWYKSFIKTSKGTVTYTSTINTAVPGTYTVTYTAKKTGFANATAKMTVTVLPMPLELTQITATRVSGKDSFTLSATLKYTGGETVSESGFVWGFMKNPTIELNNGLKTTASVIKTKNGKLSVTAEQIVDGVNYYMRPYVKTTAGNTYYGEQKDFSINGKSYGAFTIKNNNNNTFTVTRSGGTDGTQKVYFRTVNGSAVGGTHFTHQASYVTFAQGETSKTITVTEIGVSTAYNSKTATQYSNADRTYQVELYRVDGGGELGATTAATRTMAKSSSYVIDRTIYTTEKSKTEVGETSGTNGKRVADGTSKQGAEKYTNVNFLTNRYNEKNYNTSTVLSSYYTTNQCSYLNATAAGWYYRYAMRVYEDVDGYEHAYMGTASLSDKYYSCTKENPVSGLSGQLWACTFLQGRWNSSLVYYFPNTQTGGGENSGYPLKSSGSTTSYNGKTYVSLGLSQRCYLYFGANGADSDVWYVDGLTGYAIVYDTVEPQLIGAAPVAGTYKAGDKITISLIYDEIVDSTNSDLSKVSASTSWGTFTYAGGANTNVLYFTGTVPADATGTLKINSITGSAYIKDMCSATSTKASSGTASISVSVDHKKPTVSISNASITNQTAKATVTATNTDTLRYAWSQSTGLPAAGWFTCTSGATVTNRQTSGTWYLHVLGTYNATGTTAHTYQSFNFGSSSAGAMPELALSVDNSSWATSRVITLTKAPSTATVKVKTPSGTTTTVSGTSYTATANGLYTFTLTSGTETVMKSVTVSKIDRTAPAAVVEGSSNLTQSENVTLDITPSDAGGSGVKSVTGTWTRTTNGGSATTVTATLKKNSDGTYTAVTPGTTGNLYTYRLNVTVTDNAGNTKAVSSNTYTVNLKVPTITVTKKSSTTKGDTYTYSVNAQGNQITAVQLPDDTLTTVLSGTFTLTSPGTYYAIASDAAGHVVKSSAMTVAAGVDGDAPEVRLHEREWQWTKGQVTIDVLIYEKGGVSKAVWKKEGGSQKTLSYSKEQGETSVYSGTFSATENGRYTVTVTDTNGNVGTAEITVSNIDNTAPEVACSIDATPNARSGWYTDSTVKVVLSFADPAENADGSSGIQSVKYKKVTSMDTIPTSGLSSLTASQISSGSYTYSLTGLGSYYLYYEVTDGVGNVTKGFSDLIKKDYNTGSASFSRPSQGQPVSKGLTSTINLSYGPSGGCLKAGLTTSLTQIATLEPHATTSTKSVQAQYTATTSGTHYFRYYSYARNGETTTTSSYWSFFVRQVDFNSQGGSGVESQLVWTTLSSSSTSTTVQCKVTEPEAPTRTGYTFGGWYTDAKCSDGSKFDFNTQVKVNTILYAKWTANTYNVTYHLTNSDGKAYTPSAAVKKYTYGQGLTLPVPSSAKEGFTFYGWYDNAAYTGTVYTSITGTVVGDKEYYAYFKDTQAPVIGSFQCAGTQSGEDGWVKAGDGNGTAVVRAECNDNEGVTNTRMKVDDDAFRETGISSSTPGSYDYVLLEGEHTYTFKASDEAGNEAVSETIKVKYDGTAPVIGDITCEKKVTDFLDWSIGRESLVIHIPVTDSLSGAKRLTYTETRITGAGETTETKTIELSGKPGTQTADLKLDADWKGSIRNITCTDVAGNVSASKNVGTNGDIIVENNPPVITITEADLSDADSPKPGDAVSGEYYEQDDAPTLYVSVQDEGADAVANSSGIESITYAVNGSVKTVSGDFGQKLTGSHGFTIPLTGQSGVLNIKVKAFDHAGNTTAQSVTVKIKGQEKTPEAVPDYPRDALAELSPNAAYTIRVPGGEDGENIYDVTADENGRIPLKLKGGDTVIDLCGKTIGIVKKGDGANTTDSEEQTLTVTARPEALPEDKIKTEPEIAKDAEDAVVRITIDVGPGQDDTVREYSTDGGETWTDVPDDNIIRDLAPGDVTIRNKAEDDKPNGEETTITINPSETTITAAFNLNYEGADTAGAPSAQTGLSYKSPLAQPEKPVREGYDFVGWFMEKECRRAWSFTDVEGVDGSEGIPKNIIGDIINKEAENYKDNYDIVGGAITVTLYAGWRENVKPELAAVLTDGNETADGQKWYPSLSYTLTYSDNVGVTELYVKKDDGEYTELSPADSQSDGDIGYRLEYNGIEEGEHTYTFKAVDAAGNVTETEKLTAKLDRTKPVLGEISFREDYKNQWNWLIARDSMHIVIPVTETVSGVDTVEYTLTPADGQGNSTTGTVEAKEVSGRDGSYTADICITPDFKGTVCIIAKDKAGNASDEKRIGTDSDDIEGVIVEDNAPEITILADRGVSDEAATQENGTALSDEYYNTAPKLLVTVEDAGDSGSSTITAGLASVSWRIGDGEENPVSADFQSSVRTSHNFTVNALESRTGRLAVTVTAVDQAGNVTHKTVTVRIRSREEVPQPGIDYKKEKLTGLVPGAAYEIGGETFTADGQGCIGIKEDWFGGEAQISKKGGDETLDSENAGISIAARPAAPSVAKKNNETIKGKEDGAVSGVDTTMEYSLDGGASWVSVKDSDITDNAMTDLPAGEIRIRIKAVDTAPCGHPASVMISEGKGLTVSFDTNGGNDVAELTGISWKAAVSKPGEPVKKGYAFEGWYKDSGLTDIWHFEADPEGTEADRLTDDVTLYAKWRENEAPKIRAVLTDGDVEVNDDRWHTSLSCTLTYSDNMGVTHLYVKKDGGEYTELSMDDATGNSTEDPDGNTNYQLVYTDIEEGEHTYIFKAVDAAGNAALTEELTTKLDTTKPVLGKVSFSEGYKEQWNWINSRDTLLITIPVTEEGSGIDTVEYTLTPVDEQSGSEGVENAGNESAASGSGSTTETAEVTKTSGSDGGYTAVIRIEPNFRGTLTVNAKDKAGLLSDTKIIGADGNGIMGIIVEDDAPEIRFAVDGDRISEDYYDNVPDVAVHVADEGNERERDGITSGISFVAYQVGSGDEVVVDHDYTTQLRTSDDFTIPAAEIPTGVTEITVKAVDHAGNETVQTITVRVKRIHDTPNAVIRYQTEKLTGLEADGAYRINGVGVMADEEGMIPIRADWMASDLSIIQLGDGSATIDSESQELSVPARPEAPSVIGNDETYPGAGDGILTGFDAQTAYGISKDGGSTWTDVTGTEMEGLDAGTYYVCTKAVEGERFRSNALEVIIGSIPATPYEMPEAQIDYEKEVLTGLVPGGEYRWEYNNGTGEENEEGDEEDEDSEVGETGFTADEDGTISIGDDWFGRTLSIVRKGNRKDKLESEAQSLLIPERPQAPSPAGADESAPDQKDARLTGLTADTNYDISGDDGKTWERKRADVDGEIKGVDAPESYIVRVSATDHSFASLPCGVVWVYQYDDTAPVIGPLKYSYELKKAGQWLAGGKELTITVPVTEEGSGADEITYIMTPEDGKAVTDTSAITDGTAAITVSADFKGTIRITCTDRAGNTSEEVTARIILEDHAPQIGFSAENAELTEDVYKTAPDITVNVTDDKDNAVSSGLASVSYQIGDGSEKTVEHDYEADRITKDTFTIPAEEIPEGETTISVTATDHAGNSITETYTVNVHIHSGTLVPAVEPDCITAGNKEHYTCSCGKWFSDSGCTNEITDHASIIIEKQGHDFSGGYQFDEKGHWGTCSRCGETGSKETHVYDSDTDIDCNQCDYKRSIENPGSVSKDVEKDEKAPDTALSASAEELADIILTKEEKGQIENGTDIRFILDVKDAADTVSSSEKAAVQEALNGFTMAKGFAVGQYLDISLFKIIGADRSVISQTPKKLTIVIDVPDSLKSRGGGKSRTFAVIRVHNGKAEWLADLDNNTDTITIATDRFSSYAIVYKETGSGEEIKPTPTPTGKKEEASGKEKRKIEIHSRLKAIQTGKKLQISWGRVSGADGYSVYVQYCGKDFTAKSLNAVKSGKAKKITIKKINGKRLDTTKSFKMYVVAYKMVGKKKKTLAKTIIVHVAGKDSKEYTNVKRIEVKKAFNTLKKGENVKIQPKAVLYNKRKKQLSAEHTKQFRYMSSNKKVAVVTKNGKIKAVGKGSCTIYIYARNGCAKKINLTVPS